MKQTRRQFLALVGYGTAGLMSGVLRAARVEAKGKPNFVFILSDDQGWNGTSVRMDDAMPDSRSDYYRTPNLERLASQGMRFSRAYAPSPVCSPTRYSLLTGKSAARHGMTKASPVVQATPGHKLIPPSIPRQIARDETTLAHLLKRGYATAHFGKWHLGAGGPGGFGFDEHDGDTGNRDAAPHKDPNPVDIFGITRRAVAFMAKHAKAPAPFYVQLSHHALHYPENSRKATQQACAARPKGRYHHDVLRAAITEDLDAGVGELLDGIDRLGLAANTYVIYMSDNGGGGGSTNRPLTGGKGTLWEGGIRVPMIVRGPGVKAGASCGVPVTGCDLLPTLCELAGVGKPLPAGVDGGSIVPLLTGAGKGQVKRPREEIVWHFPHYQKRGLGPHSAILLGQYKLIEFHETHGARLFDLSKDIGERHDRAKAMPDKAAELRRCLRAYLKEVSARMPMPNPKYDPNTDKETKPSTSAPRVEKKPKPTTPGVPLLDEIAKQQAIHAIQQYPEVREAAITQKGRDVVLVVIVDHATSKARAKQLGDNFMRLVKTFSDAEPSPGVEIGRGVYDYLIGVYTPAKKRIALGAKVRTSPHITW